MMSLFRTAGTPSQVTDGLLAPDPTRSTAGTPDGEPDENASPYIMSCAEGG